MSRSEEHMFNEKNAFKKLNSAQKIFLTKYCECDDLKKAAAAAGYTERYAKKLIEDSEFLKLIELNRRNDGETLRQKVIDEWASIAFADVGDFISFSTDCDGKSIIELKDSAKCSDTRAVCELGQASNGTFKLKLYDKENALLQLSKLLGMYETEKEGESGENKINIELKGDVRDWAK